MEIREIEENLSGCGSLHGGEPWILTATGATLCFELPELDQINLVDICHHLGNLCRYTGAVSKFYSVAQHSLVCMAIAKRQLDNEEAIRRNSAEYCDQLLAVGLHDAEEAYVNDLSSPLKRAMDVSYKEIAVNLRRAIYDKHGIDYAYYNDTVKHADLNALVIERYFLMPESSAWPKVRKDQLLLSGLPYMAPEKATKSLSQVLRHLLLLRSIACAEDKKNADPAGNGPA